MCASVWVCVLSFPPASVFYSCIVLFMFLCMPPKSLSVFMSLHSSARMLQYMPVIDCVWLCFLFFFCAYTDFALPFPPGLIPEQNQHVNGGRKRQSCHRGAAGGAPSSLWTRHSREPPAPHTHPESEPHPVSPSDTHHPVAAGGSSRSRSHQESQSHSLQHSLTHTAAEVRLPAHTQPLSHGQGREGREGLCGEAHQTQWTTVPQNPSAGKIICFFYGIAVITWDGNMLLV